MAQNKKIIILLLASMAVFLIALLGNLIFFGAMYFQNLKIILADTNLKNNYWAVQSIDTMKFSRDLAREKMQDPDFILIIDEQTRNIALAGATHVSVATPYDEEFIPFLKKWVSAARKYNLNIWFRGNFSGWEEWFGYGQITPDEHIAKTKEFIINNPDLFEDNDIFSSCTECENGIIGDPRNTGDISGFRDFIITEHEAVRSSFKDIGKQVSADYFPMNGDVARLIMDENTTEKLNGIVVMDHYVETPEILASDIKEIIGKSKGKVILGEFGHPIPDIHGEADAGEQAIWIKSALELIKKIEGVIGINYWTNIGGSTAIWNENGASKPAVAVLTEFFNPESVFGIVKNELGKPIAGAEIKINNNITAISEQDGRFRVLITAGTAPILTITAPGYMEKSINTADNKKPFSIFLVKKQKNLYYKLLLSFKKILEKYSFI